MSPRKVSKAAAPTATKPPPPAPVEVQVVIAPALLPEIRRLQREHRRNNPAAPPLRVRPISWGRVELY